jgi:purine-cytosine permease-like protein
MFDLAASYRYTTLVRYNGQFVNIFDLVILYLILVKVGLLVDYGDCLDIENKTPKRQCDHTPCCSKTIQLIVTIIFLGFILGLALLILGVIFLHLDTLVHLYPV